MILISVRICDVDVSAFDWINGIYMCLRLLHLKWYARVLNVVHWKYAQLEQKLVGSICGAGRGLRNTKIITASQRRKNICVTEIALDVRLISNHHSVVCRIYTKNFNSPTSRDLFNKMRCVCVVRVPPKKMWWIQNESRTKTKLEETKK